MELILTLTFDVNEYETCFEELDSSRDGTMPT